MANIITEAQIEHAVIRVFLDTLGYRHLNCIDEDITGRTTETEVVIRPLLQKKLADLNPGLPKSALDEAAEQLCKTRLDQSDIVANRELYGLIRDGVPVEINNAAGKRETVYVKAIDFDNQSNNDYLVVSQLWIQGPYVRRRPDLLVFVNGLPLVFIELKNSNIALKSAYDDNVTNYRNDIPSIFNHNVLCILSNGLETKAGAFNAGFEFFFNWLRPEKENETADHKEIKKNAISLDYAVRGLCEKKGLLDYVENFILYFNESIKIAGKNHQFLGVNNATNSFAQRLEHDRNGTDPDGKGRLGVFWHTQGSGKSFSMIFFAQKIFRKFHGNFTFVIVTDRDDLDGQIYRNFLSAGAFSKDYKCRPSGSESLREMLATNTRYVFTLIQKFRFAKGRTYPVLSTRNDIIVVVDEAHRTQYKDLAENMRAGLPNAQYIAFTGTPLLGSRELTRNWFGSTVSEYNFKQSIEDGATVPLFYHKRVPEVLLQNDEIDDDLADIVSDENLTDEQAAKLEREFTQEMTVLKADDRLEIIATDIAYHFGRRGYLGKGMVICFDKFTAVRMYDKVKRLWDAEKRKIQHEVDSLAEGDERSDAKMRLRWMRETDMAVVVSEEAGEGEKFEKQGLDINVHRKRLQSVDENGHDVEYKFKDPKDQLRLAFVCSMWLTGFDAPTVSTLYLDKPMKDHTLMQTIARANRVTDHLVFNKPKANGLIVDYYNVFRNLKKAFASYGGGSVAEGEGAGDKPVQEKDELYKLLTSAIGECELFCEGVGVRLKSISESKEVFGRISLFDDYADRLLANDEHKKQFTIYDNTISALYDACRPEILERREEFVMVVVIRYLREVLEGKVDRGNLDSAKRKIEQLLNDSIVAQEKAGGNVEPVTAQAREKQEYFIKDWKHIDLSKFDVAKLREEFHQAPHKHIEISDLRAFIAGKLKQMMERNITRNSFAQRLQEIIDRYNSGGALTEDYFDELTRFVEAMREEELRASREGLTEEELELFDLLKRENLTKEEEQKVKLAARHLLKRLREEKPTVLVYDWHKDTQTRSHVKNEIQKVLDNYLPDPAYDRALFAAKSNVVFEHFFNQAVHGGNRAA